MKKYLGRTNKVKKKHKVRRGIWYSLKGGDKNGRRKGKREIIKKKEKEKKKFIF